MTISSDETPPLPPQGGTDIAVIMTAILTTIATLVVTLISIQTTKPTTTTTTTKTTNNNNDSSSNSSKSGYLPDPKIQPSKYAYEMFTIYYTPFWMASFAIIIIFQLYEDFTATSYNVVCITLASPLLLQPILFPSAFFDSPDVQRPLIQRYAFKANVWLGIYTFIGNYWYTHYFYSVLKATYTMPATRLNNVPIAMFFATHYYFSSYHVFSNACLRKIKTTFVPGMKRRILYITVVLALSYFTAFMETLTISSFPYYSFDDRDMAYTIGSAFYGIYFIVSFPAFLEFDEDIDVDTTSTSSSASIKKKVVTLWDTIVQSCGYGMIILCLLDFVRLQTGIPLTVGY